MEFQQHKLLEYISSIDSNPPFTQAEISYLELTAHFQPIFHARDGSVFGYEALARHISKNINIKKLFNKAKEEGSAVLLDMICRQIAMERASIQGIDCYLFINSCAETLMYYQHTADMTDAFVSEFKIPKERIILEITEETAIDNYESFIKSIIHYKQRGYKIAIDVLVQDLVVPSYLRLLSPI